MTEFNHRGFITREEHDKELAALKHDIEAYRGALGYSISGDHNGLLSNGDTPVCGMCGPKNNEIAMLRQDNERLKEELGEYQLDPKIEALEAQAAALAKAIEDQNPHPTTSLGRALKAYRDGQKEKS